MPLAKVPGGGSPYAAKVPFGKGSISGSSGGAGVTSKGVKTGAKPGLGSTDKSTGGSKDSPKGKSAGSAGHHGSKGKAGGGVKHTGAKGKTTEKVADAEGKCTAEREVEERKEKTRRMEEEMQKLSEDAWVAQVEYERKQEEKERKREAEKRKKRAAEEKAKAALLTAAFDGETDEMLKLLDSSHLPVDTEDSHKNTLLSEAANGGQAASIQALLQRGADPNLKGEFGRTPLWRASFMGHLDAVTALLEGGADPRIGNEIGELPLQVANNEAVKDAISSWDISKTEVLLEKLSHERHARAQAEMEKKAAKTNKLSDDLQLKKKANDVAQRQLLKAHAELEKRIVEHDTCTAEGKEPSLLEVTLQQVHAAEATLEDAKKHAAETSEALLEAKTVLSHHVAASDTTEGCDDAGIPISVGDLDEVLIRDVGGQIEKDGRWPLMIDPSGLASVFLRYLDSNYVNTCNPHQMEPNTLRRSILGAIRYGKPFVLDLMGVDAYDELAQRFDEIQKGLLHSILSKALIKDEAFLSLVKKEDGDQYDAANFQQVRLNKFKFIILTSSRYPNPTLLDQTYVFRCLPGKPRN